MKPTTVSRRRFLRTTAPAIIAASTLGTRCQAAASDRLTVGVIGAGSRGFNLINELLKKPEAQIVAVCDVDSFHYRDRPWGNGQPMGRTAAKSHIEMTYGQSKKGGTGHSVDSYRDYRELCGREDIDIIVVATPDHWHALCTLEALRTGKDVYCEKPVTHKLREGQIISREVASRAAVFQTGSQQRSSWEFRRAVELARGGYLGKILSAEIGLPSGYETAQGSTDIKSPPESLDYELWCGPAEKLPYMRARHHRWWRGHRAFGGGVLMDWIGHHNDIAHWAMGMDESGPREVEAVGWKSAKTDVYDTPWHYEIRCQYEGEISTSISDRHAVGTKIVGTDGWVFVTRGAIKASDARWVQKSFQPDVEGIYRSDDHMQNFLDCVKSRSRCIAPAEVAHRSITPGHLGYVSHQLGRKLKWEPTTQRIIDDEAANDLIYKVQYRDFN
ncbi:MAG: Gfo/Idh/MocA family oxidoreductase [Pirellulaceae bacterium]